MFPEVLDPTVQSDGPKLRTETACESVHCNLLKDTEVKDCVL